MTGSKNRPRWDDIPAPIRVDIERLIGGRVVRAENCPGGFSPGLASRLTIADGRRVFVKAVDAEAWPVNAVFHRTEALIAAALPEAVPAPRLLGCFDDGQWVVLAFEEVDGAEPGQPWNLVDLHRVVVAVGELARAATPSPIALPGDHPRLGGWAELARDRSRRDRLRDHSPWAADNIGHLVRLEEQGLTAARGSSLVHFDLYPHNIMLTPARVVFVDWPHARLGSPVVDLVTVLSSAAADGIDPEPVLREYGDVAAFDLGSVDAILAAHAGFLIHGGLSSAPPGLEPIVEAKRRLGRGALDWLRRRLGGET